MYESHFHLNDRPFASVPNPEHYFPASSIEQAREVMALNVERASGTTILMGPVGSGKTFLCQLIANQFSGELPVCMIPGGRLSNRESLLQAILHGLGLPFRGQDEGELRLTLNDHVDGQSCRNGFVLIIDEADRLPLELLEEVRMLTNLVKDGEPRVRLVMAGSHQLEELIGNPKLESLNQRVVGRLFLDNFSREESKDYIRARINACGGDAGSIFTAEACETAFRATNGVPRLLNQVCDHAMLMASVGNIDHLDNHSVEEAWADLQQLPMPSNALDSSTTSNVGGDVVIEFGSLDEDDAENDPSGQIDDIQRVVAELENEVGNATNIEIDGVEVEEEFGSQVEIEFDAGVEVEVSAESAIAVGSERTVEFDFGSDHDGANGSEAVVEFGPETAIEFGSTAEVAVPTEPAESILVEQESIQHEEEPIAAESNAEDLEIAVENTISTEEELAEEELAEEETIDEGQTDQDEIAEAEYTIAPEEVLPFRNSPPAEEVGFTDGSTSEIDVVEDDGQISIDMDQETAISDDETSPELTIDQVSNPFDEEFADEEIVIQEFASPSKFARANHEHVSSAYSRRLAQQLAAARPGLRMHSVDDDVTIEYGVAEIESEEKFEPLSAYLDDEQSYEDFEQVDSIDGRLERENSNSNDDPVMPDISISTTQSKTAIHFEDGRRYDGSVAVQKDVAIQAGETFEVEPSQVEERSVREKVFRTLFSSMRRS